MDIAGGAKEGAKKGSSSGSRLGAVAGLCFGVLVALSFLATSGTALGIVPLVLDSAVGLAVCTWAGFVLGNLFGGFTGGLFGGVEGASRDPEPPGGRTRNPPSRGPGLNNQRSAQRLAPTDTAPTPMRTPATNSPDEYARNP